MSSFTKKTKYPTAASTSQNRPDVLCIVLADDLIGIDFKRLLCQPQWNVKDQPNVTPIYFWMKELSKHFKNSKNKNEIVVGFTHMKLDNEVYLLGGERLKSGTNFDKLHVYKNPQCHGGFSSQVFHLQNNNNNNNSFVLKRCPHMDYQYGKSSPMVANIGSDYVYVICGAPYFHNNHTIFGSFEVYNLSEKYWGMLKDVPSYINNSSKPIGEILGYLVLGNKLLIKDDTGKAYFFETKLHTTWEELDENVLNSYLGVGLTLPTNGISVPFFPELNNNFQLVISREGFEDAYAMIIDASTCSLVYYQSLKEIFKGRYPVTKNGDRVRFFGGRNIFLLRPNDQLCAIWIGFDHHRRLHLFITIFDLELLDNPTMMTTFLFPSAPFQQRISSRAQETTFIKARIVHTFDCIVPDVKTPNYVFDTFFY